MSFVDFILNIAGLLLWLKCRGLPTPAGTLNTATPRHGPPPMSGMFYLSGLMALLVLRAVFYWQAGPALGWEPSIPLGPILLWFRSDFFGRMLLFSVFSFGVTLGIFYLWLLLLSLVPSPGSEADPAQRLIRRHLGPLDRWPTAAKLLLPLMATMFVWCALNPLLIEINMVPRVSAWHLVAQGAVIGLAVYFALKFLVIGFLVLYMLNSYVYLGDFAFWNFVNTTAGALLRPLKSWPLRIGRVDFAPAAGVALVMVAAELGRRGLERLYH